MVCSINVLPFKCTLVIWMCGWVWKWLFQLSSSSAENVPTWQKHMQTFSTILFQIWLGIVMEISHYRAGGNLVFDCTQIEANGVCVRVCGWEILCAHTTWILCISLRLCAHTHRCACVCVCLYSTAHFPKLLLRALFLPLQRSVNVFPECTTLAQPACFWSHSATLLMSWLTCLGKFLLLPPSCFTRLLTCFYSLY